MDLHQEVAGLHGLMERGRGNSEGQEGLDAFAVQLNALAGGNVGSQIVTPSEGGVAFGDVSPASS